MNFGSIKEYFYKVANRCYLLILLPLGIFIYLFQQMITHHVDPMLRDESLVKIVTIVLSVFALVNLTTVHFIARHRLSKYATEVGLGRKLDLYYEIVMFRIAAVSASSLMMAAGLMLTSSEVFGALFMLILVWTLFQWPTSRKVCRDLKLKGDEHEMVLYKKDDF